jgi:pyruvate dehydrogenase (quinone)
MDEAFASDRPVIIDAVTTPDEAPLPPHITYEQVKAMTKSVLAEPASGIAGAREAVMEKLREVLPSRH